MFYYYCYCYSYYSYSLYLLLVVMLLSRLPRLFVRVRSHYLRSNIANSVYVCSYVHNHNHMCVYNTYIYICNIYIYPHSDPAHVEGRITRAPYVRWPVRGPDAASIGATIPGIAPNLGLSDSLGAARAARSESTCVPQTICTSSKKACAILCPMCFFIRQAYVRHVPCSKVPR